MRQFLIAVVALALCGFATAEEPEDPYLWLEEVEGEKALEWVKERSAKDTATLEAVPVYSEIHEKLHRDLQLERSDSVCGYSRPLAVQLLARRRTCARHLAPNLCR